MPTEIDSLEVRVRANAQNATGALNSLISALGRVKAALKTVESGISVSGQLSKSLTEMSTAINGINSNGVAKLRDLSNALREYADSIRDIKGLRGSVNIGREVKDMQASLTVPVKEKMSDMPIGTDVVDQMTDALKRFNDAIDDSSKKIKKVNKNLDKTNDTFDKIWKSVKRIAFYRILRTALKDIGDAFETGLKNAYGYSKLSETFTRLADSLDRMKSAASQMVNQLGAAWGEVLQAIMPAIEWIIEKVRYISEKATEFFAALNGADYYQYARLVAENWDDATEAVKKYKHQLLGLDELNNLSNRDGSSKKDDIDYTEKYYRKLVNPNLKGIGTAWGKIKTLISDEI